MKQRRTRFSGLVAVLWLVVITAMGQSYTIRFVKGTDRINRQHVRTADNLDELITRLSGCKKQLEGGGYVVSLTALQNVVDRYDPVAERLAQAQAVYLQEYLTEACCLDDAALFDIVVDARTDLDNRVIVEMKKQVVRTDNRTIVSPPTEEDLEPFRKKKTGQAVAVADETKQTSHKDDSEQHPVQHPKVVTVAGANSRPASFLLGNIGLGIKTNALLLAGLLPDGKMYSPVVNAAAEVYFLKCFSAQLSFAYALPYNKGEKNDLFSVTAFVVEPRWWLRGDGSFRGLYTGVYGLYGTFDVRIKEEIEDNCTGSFYGGGLSVGWLQPVWRGFFAEAGLQVGYRSDAVDVYDFTPGKAYKRLGTYTLNSFTLQGINLSVGYRF